MNIKFLALALTVVAGNSCSTQKLKNTTQNKQMMNTSEMTKSQTIELKKGELFLAVVGYQMAGKEQLLQEYFGIVFPPAQKNGFTPLGKLPIDEVAAGSFMPNEFVGLFKWPNMESVQGFLSEVSPDRLQELRVEIWSELKQHMVVVSEDVALTFHDNKVYEVKMLWTDQMPNSESIENNKGKVVFSSQLAGYEDLGKNQAPNNLLIIEWDSKADAESFSKMNTLSYTKEEAFFTHFDFPEEI